VVYFIRLQSGSIKIGSTDNLGQRMANLKWTYGSIELLATIPGDASTEKEIHSKFDHIRLGRSEQFHPKHELLGFIRMTSGRDLLGILSQEVELTPAKNVNNSATLHFTISESLRGSLESEAKRTGAPLAEIVRRALAQYVGGLNDVHRGRVERKDGGVRPGRSSDESDDVRRYIG
jgi:hypothetical protein